MAYSTGMRKEEILGLQWSQVDLMEEKITLRPEDTKNKESRVIFMQGELLEVLRFQRSLRDQKFPNCPWVFFSDTGEKILDFRGSWETGCIEAGLCRPLTDERGNSVKDKKGKPVLIPSKLFHDFRRTAVRRLERASVPRSIAMDLTGHKTEDVYRRYDIVSDSDLEIAVTMLEDYLSKNRAKIGGSGNFGNP